MPLLWIAGNRAGHLGQPVPPLLLGSWLGLRRPAHPMLRHERLCFPEVARSTQCRAHRSKDHLNSVRQALHRRSP
eukprot:7879118-Heterocapsa_arctica.AAC.1